MASGGRPWGAGGAVRRPGRRAGAGPGPLAGLRRYRSDPNGMLTEAHGRSGDLATFRLGPQRVHSVGHPDLAAQVLTVHAEAFHKGRLLTAARAVLGDGPLTSEEPLHHHRQRVIAPGFAHRRVAGYGRAMVAEGEALAGSWRDGMGLDMFDQMQRVTLRVVAASLFGSALSRERVDAVGSALTDAVGIFPLLTVPFGTRLLWLPLPVVRRFRRARRTLEETVRLLVAERRADPRHHDDVLGLLLEAEDRGGEGAGPRQLRDDLVSLLVAGHETTAVALTWAWQLLGTHPDVDERLVCELRTVFGDGPIDPARYSSLRYTRSVVQETLRLYPPAWVIPRLAVRPVELGGRRIPPGDVVIVCTQLLHRDPRFWDDPARFDPARFDEGAGGRRHPAYLPFGAGPRSCLGREFALMEATLLLAALARRFRAVPLGPAPVPPSFGFTLRPAGPAPMRLSARGRTPAASAAPPT